HIIEHRKSQLHRHQKRPRTGQYNDPVLGQQPRPHCRTYEKPAPSTAATASNNPHHDPHLDQQPRPQPRIPTKPTPSTTTTASTTTHTTASSHAHRIEHSCGTHHRQRQRTHADNAATTH